MLTQKQTDILLDDIIQQSEQFEAMSGSIDTISLIDFDIEYISLDILKLHRSIISGGPIPTLWRNRGSE